MSWRDRATPVKAGGWRERATRVEAGPSTIEAVTRGAQQGASLGFADELGAADAVLKTRLGRAGGAAIGAIRGGGGVLDALSAGAGELTREGLGAEYERIRDTERAATDAAKEAHPWAYGLSEVGAGLATAPLAGGSKVPAMLAQGAVSGLGHSEAEDAAGMARDAGVGTALAAGGALLGKGVGAVVGGVKKVGQMGVDAARRALAPVEEAAQVAARGARGAAIRGGISGLERGAERMSPAQMDDFLRYEVPAGVEDELRQRGIEAAKGDVLEAARVLGTPITPASVRSGVDAQIAGGGRQLLEALAPGMARKALGPLAGAVAGGVLSANSGGDLNDILYGAGKGGAIAGALLQPAVRGWLFDAIRRGAVKAEQLGPYAAALFAAAGRGQAVFDQVAQAVAQRE